MRGDVRLITRPFTPEGEEEKGGGKKERKGEKHCSTAANDDRGGGRYTRFLEVTRLLSADRASLSLIKARLAREDKQRYSGSWRKGRTSEGKRTERTPRARSRDGEKGEKKKRKENRRRSRRIER